MKHYVYILFYKNSMKYIGVRSSKKDPEKDIEYLGSSKHLPKDLIPVKKILKVFDNRKDAVAYEIYLHKLFNVCKNPEYYNKANQTSTGFDTQGIYFKHSIEHREKIKKSLTGRTRSKEECLAISLGKKNKPRKKHSIDSRLKMSISRLGVTGYMKNEKYSDEEYDRIYRKKVKDPSKYTWFNKLSKVSVYESYTDMGRLYNVKNTSAKLSAPFRRMVLGTQKEFQGWVLLRDCSNETI